MVARKVMITLAPLPGMVPTATVAVVSPGVLPCVTDPALVCTDPATSCWFGPGRSLKTVALPAALPLFVIVTR